MNVAGDAGNVLSIIQGLRSGGVRGDVTAAMNAASLANKAGAFGTTGSTVSGALGTAGGALGLYSGLKTGGAAGYTEAALSTVNMLAGIGSLAGGAAAGGLGSLATLGAFGGPIGIALAPIMMGATQAPWTTNQDYYNRMQSYIAAGPGKFASPDNPGGPGFNGLYMDPQYTNYMAAQEALTGTDWNSLVASGQVPFAPGVGLGHTGPTKVGNV